MLYFYSILIVKAEHAGADIRGFNSLEERNEVILEAEAD